MFNQKISRPAEHRAANRKNKHLHYNKSRKAFNKESLPLPEMYYASEGIVLTGRGEWKDALCPFHQDTKPSLRININGGGFRCMACGAKGGDIIAFHMQRHGLRFVNAIKALGGKV